ncbi:MAG: tetratricopeptide repeat protein [Elusimicrobia bacterium]|nr:tetratricopeptide repeat protein [Candidatus Liberimonas magnetica]
MADTTRQQIKKDELNELVLKIIFWIKNNRTLFLNVLGILAGIIIFTSFFLVRLHTLKLGAVDKLSIAQSLFYQGDSQKAVPMLDELIRSYPKSDISSHARMNLAGYYMDQMDFQKAEDFIKPNIDSAKPKPIIPLSLAELGAIQENAQKYKEAIETYNQFLNKFPEHFFAPKIYESLARVYELTNSLMEAKASYEKLVALYPTSPWAQRAQERIDIINQSPQFKK